MNEQRKTASLGLKINTIVLTSCLIFALVCCFMLYFTGNTLLEQKYDENHTLLSVVVEQNREDIANEIFASQEMALHESVKDILKVKGIAGVGIYNKQGVLLLSSGTDFTNKLSTDEIKTLDKKAVFKKRLETNKNMASYASTIKVIGEQLGYIRLYYDSSKTNRQLNRVAIFFIVFFIVLTVFFSLLLRTLLSRFIIKPVLTLKDSMQKLDNGLLGIKVDLPFNDEIGEMGAVFNKMSDTLLQNNTALQNAVKTEVDSAIKLANANRELKRLNTALEKSNGALAQLNIDLEKKIKKRTEALMESNKRLQREIDEKEKMQEDLIRVEKLESTGVLAGGIAHDFNNLLSIIIGNLSLAHIYAKKDENISKILTDTEKSCFRARDLTKQLLTFSKGGSPVKKTMSVIELIKETAIFALRGSNVGYAFSITPELFSVKVDEGQMNQVISNIVINAGHAMPEGGTVIITGENIEIAPEKTFTTPLQPGAYIRISIKDHGTGIAKKNLQSIFDPYFTTKPTGSGLGLATAHSIIEKHKGFISVESQEAKGSTFHIYLPASTDEIHGSIDHPDKLTETLFKGRGKVLIMDDEEMIRNIVGDMLKHMGYEPDFAENGLEARQKYLDAMETHDKFNAVIMDLTIPGGMGGKEAVKEILKIDPHAKVIVSSGFSNDPVMADYKSYGFSGVVAKPFMIQELNSALRQIV